MQILLAQVESLNIIEETINLMHPGEPLMSDKKSEPMVAVINSNEDIVEMIQLMLLDAGYASIGAHVTDFKKGKNDFVVFCQQHNPQVILFDVAPPYEENWKFFQLLKNTRAAEGKQFLLTTTNKEALERLVGGTKAIEILGKPFDLEEIIAAVRKLLRDS
jgi:DNA-binding response OmpR family regulator